MLDRIILIAALTLKIAQAVARALNLPPNRWRFVSERAHLLGMAGSILLLDISLHWDGAWRHELIQLAKAQRLSIIEVEAL